MALIVEDGSAKTDAESYASVQDGTDYFDKFGGGDSFTSASQTEQEQALRNATRFIDQSVRWLSERLTDEQALEWPRVEFEDTRGITIEEDEVPNRVVEATIEMANQHLEQDLRADDPAITQESFGSSSVTYASPVRGNSPSAIILKSLSSYGSSSSAIRTVYRA